MADAPKRTDPPEEKFLSFVYPEVKDLAKHFLTLVSGVLVFSAGFADKIIPFGSAKPFQKSMLVTAWLLWIASVILTGLAIFVNYVAAVRALRQDADDNRGFIWLAYGALDTGGLCFVAGLVALAVSALSRLLQK